MSTSKARITIRRCHPKRAEWQAVAEINGTRHYSRIHDNEWDAKSELSNMLKEGGI